MTRLGENFELTQNSRRVNLGMASDLTQPNRTVYSFTQSTIVSHQKPPHFAAKSAVLLP